MFICASCRNALRLRAPFRTISSTSIAQRQLAKRKPLVAKRTTPWQSNHPLAWKSKPAGDANGGGGSDEARAKQWEPVRISSATFFKAVEDQLHVWCNMHLGVRRLKAIGVPVHDAKHLLNEFYTWAARQLEEPSARTFNSWFSDEYSWSLQHMNDFAPTLDLMISRRFVNWAADLYEWRMKEGMEVWPGMKLIHNLREAADLRYQTDAYPDARKIHRKIIMHVGPTNSGKTYNALRALAGANRGVYCGPLRLLAHEIFTRLNEGTILPAGVERDPDAPDKRYPRLCNLITGEEKRIVDERAPLASCTVEMLGWSIHYDVAVVDEIQMIGDRDRGGAWSAAVMGLMADEIHLCGEASAVPIVESLCAQTGDTLTVHHYERLSPLEAASESLDYSLAKLQEGDCLVAFSRARIFALKDRVERETKFKCAVAYGRLPPELRAEQAALFNEPNNDYGIMVASDAIGMGLNL